jgi:flagellar basal body-associated protein FliL
MSRKTPAQSETSDNKKAEGRKTIIFGLIVSAIIIALIGVMMAIEIYGERLNGEISTPADSADR